MALDKNIIQPLKFVFIGEEKTELHRFKKQCKGDNIYRFITDRNHLPPFALKRTTIASAAFTVKVSCLDGNDEETLIPFLFNVCSLQDGTDVILTETGFVSSAMNCGLKKITIEDGTNTWVSEPIFIVDFDPQDSPYFELTWKHSCDFYGIPYSQFPAFKFKFWMNEDTLVGEPEYPTETEVEADGFGNEVVKFQKQKKLNLMETNEVPEFLSDALHFMALHDTITLRYPEKPSAEEKCVDDLEIGVKWLNTGCYANLELKFITDQEIIDTACCDTILKVACYESNVGVEIINIEGQDEQAAIEAAVPDNGDCYVIIDNGTAPGNDWVNHLNEIACWDGAAWNYIIPIEGSIFLFSGTLYYYELATDTWYTIPQLTTVVDGGSDNAIITGWVPSDVFAEILRSTDDITFITQAIVDKATLVSGYDTGALFVPGTYYFKIRGYNHNCDYGLTDSQSVALP